MIELLLSINAALIAVLVALVAWIGRRMVSGISELGERFAMIARLHLVHHPEDLPNFKIGGSC